MNLWAPSMFKSEIVGIFVARGEQIPFVHNIRSNRQRLGIFRCRILDFLELHGVNFYVNGIVAKLD